MSGPLVLAIPVFRGERFLSETLASLNMQGADLRWWLQDAVSPDRTAEIARGMAREGDTIVSEPDTGQADALNRAMRRMGGEVIGFINADDCLLPGAARRVLDFFDAHPEVDLVAGGIEWMDENGAPDGSHAGRIESLAEVLDVYGVWWRERQWVQPEVFYRRALWERVGGFDTRYDLAFDFDFWVRCFLAGARVAHLPGPLARFRRHAGQKSAAAERAADEIRDVVRRHLPGAPLGRWHRWKLEAQLAYDLYQSGRAPAPRRPLGRELLRHPGWLLAPAVRARLHAACSRRFLRAEDSAR
jgi:glycosyltransferase involved in cell wall biosynthesis